MEESHANTLTKQERLHGKKSIELLLAEGKHGSLGKIRYIYRYGNTEGCCRILISVPKKLFKKAVRRNQLKRRIRESWRRLKHEIKSEKGIDILLLYATKEAMTYHEIYSHIEKLVARMNNIKEVHPKSDSDETPMD